MSIEIWVDADSVPVNLRQIILRAASRLDVPCCFAADRELADVKRFVADDTFRRRQNARDAGESDPERIRGIRSKVRMAVVQKGQDSADDFLVDNAGEGSLCITHDIPLAARLLGKGCIVIDDRGAEYTRGDINVKLKDRLVNQELRSWGVYAEQQGKIDASRQKSFADTLDRTLTRMRNELEKKETM